MMLNLENFEKSYNLALFREHFHQYFEMLLQAKLLNLKTFHLCKIKDSLVSTSDTGRQPPFFRPS